MCLLLSRRACAQRWQRSSSPPLCDSSMAQPTVSAPVESDVESFSSAQMVHSLIAAGVGGSLPQEPGGGRNGGGGVAGRAVLRHRSAPLLGEGGAVGYADPSRPPRHVDHQRGVAATEHHAHLREHGLQRQGGRRRLEEPGARRPRRFGRRAPGTLHRLSAREAHRQGDPIDEHLGGELSLQGPASGGTRGAGGGAVVPRFHGSHAQGDGRRDQPDFDQGAGRAGRETQPQAGRVAGGPPPLRRHGLPLRRQNAAPDGAAGGVLQRRLDRRAKEAGGVRSPAGHHSNGGRQQRGPRAIPDVVGRQRRPGNAAQQSRPRRPRQPIPRPTSSRACWPTAPSCKPFSRISAPIIPRSSRWSNGSA